MHGHADADGAGELLDGDMPLKESFDYVEDQQRVLPVEDP